MFECASKLSLPDFRCKDTAKTDTHNQNNADNSSTEKFLPLFPSFPHHPAKSANRPQNGKIFTTKPFPSDEMGKNRHLFPHFLAQIKQIDYLCNIINN